MSFESQVSELVFQTDGVSTDFALTNLFFINSGDIRLVHVDLDGNAAELTNGVDFAVTGDGRTGSGTLSTSEVLADGGEIRVWCDTAIIQPERYQEDDGFPAEAHERAQDRHVMMVRDLARKVGRAVRAPDADLALDMSLEAKETRAGKAAGYDGAGLPATSQSSLAQIDAAVAAFEAGDDPADSSDGVTHTDGGTGAIAQTVGDRLRWTVNVMDYIPKAQWEDCEDGSIATDQTPYIHAALDARGRHGCGVRVPAGITLGVGTALLVGGASTRAQALVCEDGRAVLKGLSGAGHGVDLITLAGIYDNIIPGRQYTPVKLSGFDILAGNNFRDIIRLRDTDHPEIEQIATKDSWRNALTLRSTAGAWIENPVFRQICMASNGHHAIYIITDDGSYANDGTWENIEVRGMGFYSVPRFGINATSQKEQLGAALYVISRAVTSGSINNHHFTSLTVDAQGSVAVANGSRANPSPIVFGNGGLNQVIEGTAVQNAFREFGAFVFDFLRCEDITVPLLHPGWSDGGLVGVHGDASRTDSGPVGVGAGGSRIEQAEGGGYSTFTANWGTAGAGQVLQTSAAPGAIAKSTDDFLRESKEFRATDLVTDATGKRARLGFDKVNDRGVLSARNFGTSTQLGMDFEVSDIRIRPGGGVGDMKWTFSNASPEGVVTAAAKGCKHTDMSNGNEYIFRGTPPANTGWVLLAT